MACFFFLPFAILGSVAVVGLLVLVDFSIVTWLETMTCAPLQIIYMPYA